MLIIVSGLLATLLLCGSEVGDSIAAPSRPGATAEQVTNVGAVVGAQMLDDAGAGRGSTNAGLVLTCLTVLGVTFVALLRPPRRSRLRVLPRTLVSAEPVVSPARRHLQPWSLVQLSVARC